jgi:predicted nicotinamide N-methyase
VFPSAELLTTRAPLRPVDGLPGVVAHQSADLVALWQAWEAESGRTQGTPFWAAAWPAGIVLARCIQDRAIEVAGRRVLDLGCGGGIVAMAAVRAGAKDVEANDIDVAALEVARRNAAANGVSLRTTEQDYSAVPLPAVEVVLVADLFYERRGSERMLERLRAAAAGGTAVYVADGGRAFAPRDEGIVVRTETVAVDADLEGVASRTVRVIRL